MARIGPRGLTGLLGWSFFDPANLLAIPLILASAGLVVTSMRGRGAPDWGMALALYLCLLAFLRGYFFHYYHGRLLGRLVVLAVLCGGLAASAVLWRDRALPFEVLRDSGAVQVTEAEGLRVAAVLHLMVVVTLLIHTCLPRRWLVKTTHDVAERAGAEDYLARSE